MYNRYIPQSDGTFMRKRMEEPHQIQAPQQVQQPHTEERNCEAPPPPPRPKRQPKALEGFFSQLLPQNFDTGDLIVVLLLLLMAADCPEDQNTALLTLALYLFL